MPRISFMQLPQRALGCRPHKGVAFLALAALLFLVVVNPTASAEAVSGSFRAVDPLILPPSTTVSGVPLAFFVNNTNQTLTAFTVRAQRLSVDVMEYETAYVDSRNWYLSPMPFSTRQFLLADHSHAVYTNATVTYLGDGDLPEGAPGWLGLYPVPTATRFSGASESMLEVVASTKSPGHPVPAESSPDAWYYYYAPDVSRPHIDTRGAINAQFTGAGIVKAAGPDILIESDEGAVRIRTGSCCGGFAGKGVDRWAVLEWTQGTMEIATIADTTLATADLRAKWDGEAVLGEAYGELTTATARMPLPASTWHVTGAFDALIVPTQEGSAPSGLVHLQGDIQASTLSAQKLPLAERLERDDGRLTIPLTLGTLALIGAAVSAVSYARTRAKKSLGAITLETLRAHFREEGVAEYEAALLHASLENFDEAERLIVLALAKNPALYRRCSTEPAWGALAGRASFGRALDDAADRVFTPPDNLA
jgi:hypothetical protein